MKFISKIAVALLSVSLIACSSNTQNTNTALGATTGAVAGGLAGSLIGQGTGQIVAIGTGAIAGALLGGYIGNSMDSSDKTHVYQTMDSTPAHKTSYWKNERTGTVYKVVPVSKKMKIHGHYNCRKYVASAIINGQKQRVSGVACRQADGSWKAVR